MALPFIYEANGTSTRNITFSSPVETGSPPSAVPDSSDQTSVSVRA
ncbi:hypothetical protein DGo_CA2621 [Deinococcus gobiensis I-0]|uniref:Uncharacterized protein n=1 Tax=Deinococcus gobiensis (strain DSM 21396 / JCM 16679 / CGMCC 1.7299 / I-0) TaxID=745776 RepID=H8GT96_DEIGI|nr:hypothetical protein DGo_CA2621 [Deinococcus gobiensis I-0]